MDTGKEQKKVFQRAYTARQTRPLTLSLSCCFGELAHNLPVRQTSTTWDSSLRPREPKTVLRVSLRSSYLLGVSALLLISEFRLPSKRYSVSKNVKHTVIVVGTSDAMVPANTIVEPRPHLRSAAFSCTSVANSAGMAPKSTFLRA